ncbi:AbrB/MazE/SpoVT family DNA-binding domain-containing protein [Haladaptatus sp. DFWS20]|uniref:AbrB/MazE/SpoVT family DNA-binding domain-containing protein n=1 Tax=Haladaptatus sp. DFWS20 TaxID=3403467 RepID=UPI003EBF17A3
MASSTRDPEVVRVSQKGQATIPKALREKFGIETPGEVFVYEEGERIIIEPIPSFDELHGIHASEHEPGEVLEKIRKQKDEERRRDEKRAERLRPSKDADSDT